MAVLVETRIGSFLIDPGAALAPRRYNLPPHIKELETLSRFLDKIHNLAKEVDYFIVTHYHRDHYMYRDDEKEYYRGKIIYAKNPYSRINPSQRIRAHILFKKMNVESLAGKVIYSDNMVFHKDKVKLEFSQPLPHGECNTKLGWVIAVTIEEDGYAFTFASDTQECLCSISCDYLISKNPDIIVMSGPPTYLSKIYDVSKGMNSLIRSLKSNSTIIIDHHLLRDRDYIVYMNNLRSIRSDITVVTAAEYMGMDINQLEAYRDKLWGLNQKHTQRE